MLIFECGNKINTAYHHRKEVHTLPGCRQLRILSIAFGENCKACCTGVGKKKCTCLSKAATLAAR